MGNNLHTSRHAHSDSPTHTLWNACMQTCEHTDTAANTHKHTFKSHTDTIGDMHIVFLREINGTVTNQTHGFFNLNSIWRGGDGAVCLIFLKIH